MEYSVKNVQLFIFGFLLKALFFRMLQSSDAQEYGTNTNLPEARAFLADYNKRLREYHYKAYVDYYAMATNMTDENSKVTAKSEEMLGAFEHTATEQARRFKIDGFPTDIKRQLTIIRRSASPKDPEKRRRIITISQNLQKTFASTRLVLNSTHFVEQAQVKRFLGNIASTSERRALWGRYSSRLGRKLIGNFSELVQLYNDAAKENGYENMVQFWLDASMEDRRFDIKAWDFWEQIAPAYKQLHAFIRWKLRKKYPDELGENDPIPDHLKRELATITVPYPDVTNPIVTDEMERQGYTVQRMYKMAEDFFVSLGMEPMTDAFWENSMMLQPSDRMVQCGGAAFDMWDKQKQDYRIKFCTRVNQKSFKTVHHEMGHIQYYMIYRDQPTVFRRAPNNGFHEAIGDVIGRAFETVTHLQTVGLLNKTTVDTEEQQNKLSINSLMAQAIRKLFIVPYILVVDGWRSAIFNGSTQPDMYNTKWWEMRINYEGLSPPAMRSGKDLDAGIIYHIPAMVPADMRYFVSFIVQFQFQKALCKAANHRGPVHLCDIYGSKEAGEKLKAAMRLGRSKPWQDVLEQLTGQRNIDPSAILEYFQPLTDWLTEHNRRHNYFKEPTDKPSTSSSVKTISYNLIPIFLFSISLIISM